MKNHAVLHRIACTVVSASGNFTTDETVKVLDAPALLAPEEKYRAALAESTLTYALHRLSTPAYIVLSHPSLLRPPPLVLSPSLSLVPFRFFPCPTSPRSLPLSLVAVFSFILSHSRSSDFIMPQKRSFVIRSGGEGRGRNINLTIGPLFRVLAASSFPFVNFPASRMKGGKKDYSTRAKEISPVERVYLLKTVRLPRR